MFWIGNTYNNRGSYVFELDLNFTRKKLLKDKALLGSFVGVLANIVMDVPQYPLWKLKILEHPLSHYAGSLFLDLNTLHHSWIGSVVSFFADYSYSAFCGIVFIYFLEYTGKRYYALKGLLFGAFLWLFSFGGLRSLALVKLREVVPADFGILIGIHLLFGLAMGLIAQFIEKRAIHN